ncbi:MAG: S-methyl-5-thioribose-1-phosphate isomerase [Acidimicrobiia bacterium]
MELNDPIPATLCWVGDRVRLIDQRALPGRLRFVECAEVDELCRAVSDLVVRGAPALGAAGAFGVALALARLPGGAGSADALAAGEAAGRALANTRPTAVNLARGAGRALEAARAALPGGPWAMAEAALDAALALVADDAEVNRALGRHGASLVPDGARVFTHCNSGSLAATSFGTGLGIVRAAAETGRRPTVWVGETRPVLQGARLTAWELDRLGIGATIVVDAMAGSLMAEGAVDLVVVGADRVAANGDVANKVGTYSLAVLARHHEIPFYVAAPLSTIDLATATGADVPIEARSQEEVLRLGRSRVAPRGATALNRAFDVTPAELVTAIVTEVGVCRSPYPTSLASLAGRRPDRPGPAATPPG